MSFAASNDHLPNGPNNRWDNADNESTPRSSGVEDNQNETIEVPFHGSCPKCHHFHTNSPFTIFTNSTKHSRFQCDACKHHMLGLGRASTQTTLASVESIPVLSNRQSLISRPSNLQICVNAPPQAPSVNSPTSADDSNIPTPLSTITEANTSNGRSRSPSYRQARLSISPQRSISPNPRVSLRDNGTSAQEQLGEGRKSTTRSSSRFKLGVLFRRGKERLLPKSGKLKMFGFNITITRVRPPVPPDSTTPRPNLDAIKSSTTDARITPVRNSTAEVPNLGRTVSNPPSPVADTSQEPAGPSLEVVDDEARPTNPQRPDAEEVQDLTTNPAEAEADADEDQRAEIEKIEKIRVRRREATLKSEALRKPYCLCRAGCPCLGDGGESDGATEGHAAHSQISVSEVPSLPFLGPAVDSSRSSSSQASHGNVRLLSGIGSHISLSQVYAYRRISHAENPSSGADSNRRQAQRLSQDTTTWGSNESSISLTGRRSTPGPAMPSHRSSGRIAVQNFEDQLRHQGSSRGRESVELPTRGGEAVPNGPDPDISDESSASPNNMLNLGAEQEVPQTSLDGTSISSDATCIDEPSEQLENQESTPRPHIHNAAADNSTTAVSEPSPESLSTALTNLAEGRTND